MAETTGISWTDSTINFWIGCTKVGPGCQNCYAEAMNHRFGGGNWGAGAPRKRTAQATRNNLLKWQREADKTGVRRKVFINSMSDFWDNEVPIEWREEDAVVMAACDGLDLQLVTKRIGNVPKLLPRAWSSHWPAHVWQMITVCNHDEYLRDTPKLAPVIDMGCKVTGLSAEPLLGPIRVGAYADMLKWVIVGGESGSFARRYNIEWAMDIADNCSQYGIAFFHKQLGSRPVGVDGRPIYTKDRSGTHSGDWPKNLCRQEFPVAA